MIKLNRVDGTRPSDDVAFVPKDDSQSADIESILQILPADVREALKKKEISVEDPGFIEGLMDHASRMAISQPEVGRRLLGKIIELKKRLMRQVRDDHPGEYTSGTVTNTAPRIGRNDKCPCGSGKKYKQCCMREDRKK